MFHRLTSSLVLHFFVKSIRAKFYVLSQSTRSVSFISHGVVQFVRREAVACAFCAASLSSLQLANFPYLCPISQHQLAPLVVFPLSPTVRSSSYVAKRSLAL